MATKYQKFGLRADKNLRDLPDRDTALANILDGIAVGDVTFSPGDLRVINGIRNISVNRDDLAEVDENVQEYTPLNSSTNRPLEPLITVKDAIDNFKVILGEPPYLSGGTGPDANIYPSDLLVDQSTVTSTTSGAALLDIQGEADEDRVQGPLDFWDNGVFRLDTKLHPEFSNPYGAVQWEGYADFNSFSLETTGLFIIEQDVADDGNFEIYRSVYDRDIVFGVSSATYDAGTDQTTIQLSDWEEGKHLVEGAVTKFYTNTSGDKLPVISISYDIDNESSSFVVEGDASAASTAGNITIEHELGADTVFTTGTIRLYESYRGDKIKTRITWWYPDYDDGAFYQTKSFICNPGTQSERLPYSFWYKEFSRDDTPGVNSIEYFLENKAGPTAPNSTAPLQVNNSLFMNYEPPEDIGDKILRPTSSFSFTHDSFGKLIGNFTDVEEGDWLVFTYNGARFARMIDEVRDSNTVFVNDYDATSPAAFPPSDPDGNTTITGSIFKHNGLIGVYLATYESGGSTSKVIEIPNGGYDKDLIRDNYLMAGVDAEIDGSNTGSKFFRLGDVADDAQNAKTASFNPLYNTTAFPTTTNAGAWFVGVYNYTGLQDLSAISQCVGTYGKEVQTTVTGGDTIQLFDVSGVQVGDYAQFVGTSGFINGSPNASSETGYVAAGTRVSAINISTNTITLESDNPTADEIVGQVSQNGTIVFIRPSANQAYDGTTNVVDREFCVLPLNTAPPFEGTDTGLRTSTAFPHIQANTLAVKGLDITLSDPNAIQEKAPTDTSYTKYLPITYNGVTYKAVIK